MIVARIALYAIALMSLSLPALAQVDDGFGGDDTGTAVDTVGSDTLDADSQFFQGIDEDESFNPPEEQTFFRVRGGFFGGPIVELTSLKPKDLDPVLEGDLVIYGAQGYVLLNSWLFGGGGMSAHLYDMSPKYDRFDFGYGGFLTGYDTKIFSGALSLQGTLMLGAGGLEMLKKRPDITDPTGNEILERYRDEGFFLLRPGISIGYSPVQFIEFRAGVHYLYPIGGESVEDLRALSYGLHLMLTIGD